MTRLFACSLAFASTLAFSASALAAPKSPEIYFYPSSQWTNDSVETEQNGLPQQSCVISTNFNNGFFMQMSGGKNWVETMDIDFQQNIFTAGDFYDVTLTIPGLQNKAIQAQATSANNLSISLSDAQGFYKDLRNSSVLDFKVDNNNFRFYMVGLANQAPAFEKCMANSTVIAKAGYVPEVKAPVVQEATAPTPVHTTTPEPLMEAEATAVRTVPPAKDGVAPAAPGASQDLQAVMERRAGRRRLSERLDAQIQENPAIFMDNYDAEQVATQNPNPHIMPAVPSSAVQSEQLNANTQTIPSRTNRSDFGFYKSRISEPPAPNWDAYEPNAGQAARVDVNTKATSEPQNLLLPPGFDQRP